jgi:hypothetical protein
MSIYLLQNKKHINSNIYKICKNEETTTTNYTNNSKLILHIKCKKDFHLCEILKIFREQFIQKTKLVLNILKVFI